MGSDLIVNLYENNLDYKALDGIKIQRILSPQFHLLESFIGKHFSVEWQDEVKAGMYQVNPTIFIAVKNSEIVGFAAFDCTAKGYFGPTGVNPAFQKQGIGTALLLSTLSAMREFGYGYAIIGGAGEHVYPFYSKHIKLTKYNRVHSVYDRMIKK